MSKIRPLFNPCFTVSTPDGRDGIRIRQLKIADHRQAVLDAWKKNPNPSRTYNTHHSRERGRMSFDVELPAKEVLVALVRQEVEALASEYNYAGRNISLASNQILLYFEGAGCPVHCDDQDPADRDYGLGTVMFNWANQLVALLYLSTEGEDFEGGRLHFPNANLQIDAVAGKLVTFPGHYKYKHGVTAIRSGARSLLQTTWRFDL